MTTLDPEQAYLALLSFLEDQWRQAGQPNDIGMFLGFCLYTPGEGTADPAMWTDWLAAINKVQTGVVLPDPTREALIANSMRPMDLEQAYLAMFAFIEEYWERVGRPPALGHLLDRMRLTPGTGIAEPTVWRSWFTAVDSIQKPRSV